MVFYGAILPAVLVFVVEDPFLCSEACFWCCSESVWVDVVWEEFCSRCDEKGAQSEIETQDCLPCYLLDIKRQVKLCATGVLVLVFLCSFYLRCYGCFVAGIMVKSLVTLHRKISMSIVRES